MNIKDAIRGLVATFLFSSLCIQCTSIHLKSDDPGATAKYKKMVVENKTAIATLDSVYEEVTIKVLKVPIKSYNFTYSFEVEGRSYKGEHSFQGELPKTDTMTVNYLPEDPSVNCTPQQMLARSKDKEKSYSDLVFAIIWGLLACFFLVATIASFKERTPDPQ